MTFEKYLILLAKLNLPEDQFVIVGSGPLGIRNLRKCKDLDLLVTEKLWNDLTRTYPVIQQWGVNRITVEEEIEILGEGSAFQDPNIASIDEIIKTADIIDGIRYINLGLLKKFKQKLGREKDYQDIKLIDEFLKNNPPNHQ